MSRRSFSWTDLPGELLFNIAKRLERRPDVGNFREVCNAWRWSTPLSYLSRKNVLSNLFPHRLFTPPHALLKNVAPPIIDEDLIARLPLLIDRSLILVASSVLLIKPSQIEGGNIPFPPWLISVEELGSGKVHFRRPLTRFPTMCLPENQKVLGMSRVEVVEMGRFYSLRFADALNELYDENHKVLLVVDPKCKTSPTADDCKAVVLYGNGRLASIRLKDELVQEVTFKGRRFDDIVEHKGKIYTIDRYGRVYWIDTLGSTSNKLQMSVVVEEPLPKVHSKGRLVESGGELYVVYRHGDESPEVYMLNDYQHKWEKIAGINDDRILFVAFDCCFFARTSDFPGWTGNCIVFQRDAFARNRPHNKSLVKWVLRSLADHENSMGTRDIRMRIDVFQFADGKCQPVESYGGYSDLFWPPPAWLSFNPSLPQSVSGEGEEVEKVPLGDCEGLGDPELPPYTREIFRRLAMKSDVTLEMEAKGKILCSSRARVS